MNSIAQPGCIDSQPSAKYWFFKFECLGCYHILILRLICSRVYSHWSSRVSLYAIAKHPKFYDGKLYILLFSSDCILSYLSTKNYDGEWSWHWSNIFLSIERSGWPSTKYLINEVDIDVLNLNLFEPPQTSIVSSTVLAALPMSTDSVCGTTVQVSEQEILDLKIGISQTAIISVLWGISHSLTAFTQH